MCKSHAINEGKVIRSADTKATAARRYSRAEDDGFDITLLDKYEILAPIGASIQLHSHFVVKGYVCKLAYVVHVRTKTLWPLDPLDNCYGSESGP